MQACSRSKIQLRDEEEEGDKLVEDVPSQADFLNSIKQAVLNKKQSSRYSSNFLMKSPRSSHEGSDNNSVQLMLDHLGAKPFGESLEEGSRPNSRRNSTKSKFSAKEEPKSSIINEPALQGDGAEGEQDPRDEIFDTDFSGDGIGESMYNPVEIKKVPTQTSEKVEMKEQFTDKRRQSLFAAIPNQSNFPAIVLTLDQCPSQDKKAHSESFNETSTQKMGEMRKDAAQKIKKFKSKEIISQLKPVPKLDLLSLQRSRANFQAVNQSHEETNSPGIQRKGNKKMKASQIDPQKKFSEERSWREVSKVAARNKEVIQSFSSIKRMKKLNRVEIQRKLEDKPSKDSNGSSRKDDSQRGKIVHIKKIKGTKTKKNDQTPTHSFGREKSYKTMGSWKTAASDNSFLHKNLNSLGSYISHKSTNSLQALAQITETAKQQYLQPLTKESLSYDLEGTLEKIDLQLKKYEFSEKQLSAIDNFKSSLRAKYDLAVDLVQLEAKISSTLEESFQYCQKEANEHSFTNELNSQARESSKRKGPLSLREHFKNPLRRSQSGQELRKPPLTSASFSSQNSVLGRSFGFSERKRQNYNSSSSKHSGSRSPASDILPPDPSQQPQIKQILENIYHKSRSNSASSTNTTKSWSRLEQIDEKKEACETSPLRSRAPKKKSRFNCIKQFQESDRDQPEGFPEKADEMLQNQSFSLEFYQLPKKELTIVPQEAKAVNSTYNQFDGGDFCKIESLQDVQFSKLLSEMQLKRTNSNCSRSEQSNSNESQSVSFSDTNQGQLIHLKNAINKSTLSPRRPRDKRSDYSGKNRSQTRSPINPIKEEVNEGRLEDFFQIKRQNLFDGSNEDENNNSREGSRSRRPSAKEIDKYQIEGESFNVVIHKDKSSTKWKKKEGVRRGEKLERASDISLDESFSGISEGMLSVSAIHPEGNSVQNLVSQNSGTVNMIVGQQCEQNQEEEGEKESSELEEEGSVEEEEVKGNFSSYLLPSKSKLQKSYPIKRTSTTIQGRELFRGSPLLKQVELKSSTNDSGRRNTVAQPIYKAMAYSSSRRIKQKFTDLRIQQTLVAISEAEADPIDQLAAGKQPLHQKYSFGDSNNFDARSMPDLSPWQEDDILPSLEELSEGAHSDHILDFGRFIVENLDYFGDSEEEQKEKRCNKYRHSTRIIQESDNSCYSETEGVAESNSGEETVIEEVTNESQEESKSDKRHQRRGVRDFYSSRMLNSQRVQRLPLQRRSTMSFELFELQEEQSSNQMNQSQNDSSYQSPPMIKSQSMEFTPSMLESVRNMELSSTAKVQISNFHILKRLSKGAYGYVVLAEKKSSKDLFAIKIMNVKEVVKKNQMELLTVEKDILNSVHSDFVVHGAYTFKDDHFLYIAMEYLPGGDLAALLQNECRFEWDEAKFYLKEIVQALEYLRSMEYVHRDLKPDNILLDKEGHLKLTDFGLSRAGLMEKKDRLNKSNSDESNPSIISVNVSSSSLIGSRKRPTNSQSLRVTAIQNNQEKRILGTPNYMSPEVIEGKDHSYPVDYWSLGVIAYEIIVGALPFSGDTVQELFKNILEGKVQYPDIDEEVWPASTDDFVKRLLDPNPKSRLGSKSIEQIKQHPYFEGVDWSSRNLKPPYVPEIKHRQDFVNQDQNRLISDQSFMRIIRATAAVGTPKRRSVVKNKRVPSILGGGLETVQEERKFNAKEGRRMDDWESLNVKFLKELNKTEARKKIASYFRSNDPQSKKRNPQSLMEELKPNDPVIKRLQQRQKLDALKKSPTESTFKREASKVRKFE